MNIKTLNYKVLLVFAPILILTGVAGFLVPPEKAFTSGETAYNLFHIFFGALGLILVFARNENFIRAFNLGFGLIDLYQAFASFAHLFPEQYFKWKRADDRLHVAVGALLVAVALYGILRSKRRIPD